MDDGLLVKQDRRRTSMRPARTPRLVAFALLALAGPALAGGPLRYIDPDAATGGAVAVVVPPDLPLIHTAQLLPLDAQGRLVGRGGAPEQVEQVLRNLAAALMAAGSSMDRLVKVHVY